MIVFTDENEKRNFIKRVNEGQKMANEIRTAWNRLPLQNITAPDQLKALIETPELETYAVTMLPKQQGPVQLFGVTLRPARVLDLMDLDFTEVQKTLNVNYRSIINEFMEVAQATKSNGFEVNKHKLSEKLKTYDVVAITPRQKEIASTYKQAADALAKLVKMGAAHENDFFHTAPGGHWLTKNGDSIDIRPSFYRRMAANG